MKRKVVTFLMIIICYLLQTTIFQYIPFMSITPNLLIIVTASYGFMRGSREGMFVGFVCGLILDIFSNNPMGFYALIYLMIGDFNGFFQWLFYDEDINLPLVLIAASELLYSFTVCFLLFIINGRFDFWYYFSNIIMPELIYTILITLGLYHLILYINHRLETEEKRSASKFV